MGKVKIFVVLSGNTLNSDKQFMDSLPVQHKQVNTADECDVILLFCPIVSRVGTDIEAALKDWKENPSKHIILVVLHHTFDKEQVVPDSRKYGGEKIHVVNCLFHEDVAGLLKKCDLNASAIKEASVKLKELEKKRKMTAMTETTGEAASPKEHTKKVKKKTRRSSEVHAEKKRKMTAMTETTGEAGSSEEDTKNQHQEEKKKKKKKTCNIL